MEYKKKLEDEISEKVKERDIISNLLPEANNILTAEIELFQRAKNAQVANLIQIFNEL